MKFKVKKIEERHDILYVRVQKKNKQKAMRLARKKRMSAGQFVDSILDQVSEHDCREG